MIIPDPYDDTRAILTFKLHLPFDVNFACEIEEKVYSLLAQANIFLPL